MKPWYTSKIIWTNTILCLLAVIDLALELQIVEDHAVHLLFAAGVLNIVLRYFFTDTRLE